MINLKKGKPSDITIYVDSQYQQVKVIDQFIKEIGELQIPFIVENNTENSRNQYNIKYFINPTVKEKPKPKPKTKKKIPNIDELDELLKKYQNIPDANEEAKKDNDMEAEENGNLDLNKPQLRLNLIYITRQFFDEFESLDQVFEFLKEAKCQNKETKNLLLLEDLKDIIAAKSLKRYIQSNQNDQQQQINYKQEETIVQLESQQDICQTQNQQLKRKSIQATEEEFQNWLCEINLDLDLDYHFTFTQKDSLSFLCNCISSVIHSKYKKPAGLYDAKQSNYSDKSLYAGINDQYTLLWINMLLSIQGVSEEKAIAIVKKYPTMKCLIDGYLQQNDIQDREKMLQNIEVHYNYDQENKKKLGLAISQKIYNILTNSNKDDLVNNKN